jgi:transcription initiation factor TFIIH subunit 1
MTTNVANRLDGQARKSKASKSPCRLSQCSPREIDDIPDGLFRQMTTCQTAAYEFLRQFWLATYPPPVEHQISSPVTPAQRAAKAAKMIGYISKTADKVQALVDVAQYSGIDPSRIKNVGSVLKHLSPC